MSINRSVQTQPPEQASQPVTDERTLQSVRVTDGTAIHEFAPHTSLAAASRLLTPDRFSLHDDGVHFGRKTRLTIPAVGSDGTASDPALTIRMGTPTRSAVPNVCKRVGPQTWQLYVPFQHHDLVDQLQTLCDDGIVTSTAECLWTVGGVSLELIVNHFLLHGSAFEVRYDILVTALE